MIITQTPLRISLFGGGTDFPDFYLNHGGCVLTTAINKYIFVIIKKRFGDLIRVGYSKTEIVDDLNKLDHELIRESLRIVGIDKGIEISTMADIPSTGTGLGSSSSVTVGSLHAMYAYKGNLVTSAQLAEESCKIEIEKLKKPIGKQDQYAVSYGGMSFIEFKNNGDIAVRKINLNSNIKQKLNENLLLFYTGITRKSESILGEQKEKIKENNEKLLELKYITNDAMKELELENLDKIGNLLHKSWLIKKSLASNISNDIVDNIYDVAIKSGAIGGKITGSGGGGFLLLYVPLEKKENVRKRLSNLIELPFLFENDGSKIIFNNSFNWN